MLCTMKLHKKYARLQNENLSCLLGRTGSKLGPDSLIAAALQ
jgi:hypothetical protein